MSDDRFNLTRRKALLGLGGIGAGAALGGTGTMAYLNDRESTHASVTAGTLDLKLDWKYWYHGKETQSSHKNPSNNPGPMFELEDVKPGDWGCGALSVHLDGNPAHVWFQMDDLEQHENGMTDPESEVDDNEHGDLAENIEFVAFPLGCYSENQNASAVLETEGVDPSTRPSMDEFTRNEDGDGTYCYYAGNLKQAYHHLKRGKYLGSHDDGTCYYGFCWWIPTDVGNIIQGDSASFDMKFYAEQERHNDHPKSPFITSEVKDGWPKYVTDGKDHWTVQARAGELGNDDDVYGFADGRNGFSRKDRTWQGNTDYDFTLTYDGSDEATFSIDGTTISSTSIPGAKGNLALVAKDYADGYDVTIEDVSVGGNIDGATSVTSDAGGLRHLGIHGMRLEDGFTLEGTLRFEGSGQVPEGSGAGMQITVQY